MRKNFYWVIAVGFALVCSGGYAQTSQMQPMPKEYRLYYDSPAPNNGGVFRPDESDRPIDVDWENSSLPIGNGYMGGAIFGRTDSERIQITDKTLYIKGLWGTVTQTAFADLYIDFFHQTYGNYRRSLDLNDAVCRVEYVHDQVTYRREYFASYPDKVMVVKLTADRPGKLTFTVRPQIPYLVPFGPLQRTDSITKGYLSGRTVTRHSYNGRTGKVVAQGDILSLRGQTEYLKIDYEGRVKVIPYGGKLSARNDMDGENGTIQVEKADSAVILFSLGTNYLLDSQTFLAAPPHKLDKGTDPHEGVVSAIEKAAEKGFEALYADHKADYTSFFNRAFIDLGGKDEGIPTDRLLAAYKAGKPSAYLEELFFQYGRYLLIATSRKGTLPPTLQGVWNQYELAPWNGNYTHNINIQMNYWPAFSTNLAELFESYADYQKAYRESAERIADNYIRRYHPKEYSTKPHSNGWVIGAAGNAYEIGAPGGHSGPGTGGLTSKLFWDYYAFTADRKILEEISYPIIEGVARFLSKTVVDTLGYTLAYPSSSPEQFSKLTGKPYPSMGCAFDQQMIYETYHDALTGAKILGRRSPLLRTLQKQIKKLDPVQVGLSGQVKEYREEQVYGDIVLEKNHRHISNLIGLYPGTLINTDTKEWLKAAQTTLNLRGDISTGWSMAHKLNLWARTKDGNRAYQLLQALLSNATLDNLWTTCKAVLRSPYQIDANFGGTAGIAEMLLQSHEGYIELLPALPDTWRKGHYEGLVARGNFVIGVLWDEGHIQRATVFSRKGQPCRLMYKGKGTITVKRSDGQRVRSHISNGILSFPTEPETSYMIEEE